MEISSGRVDTSKGIDSERDSIGVVLGTQLICGMCWEQMDHVKEAMYRCPHCGMIFNNVNP